MKCDEECAKPSRLRSGFHDQIRRTDGSGATFFGQKHIGLDIAKARQRHDPAAEHTFKIGQVTGNNPQAIVEKPKHMLHHLHLRDSRGGAFEILKADPALGGKLYAQKHGDPKAKRGAVHIHPPPGQHARLLQPPDAAPGGGLRQAQLAAKLTSRKAAIQRQRPKKTPIQIVKLDHSGRPPLSLIVATSISASTSAMWGSARIRSR